MKIAVASREVGGRGAGGGVGQSGSGSGGAHTVHSNYVNSKKKKKLGKKAPINCKKGHKRIKDYCFVKDWLVGLKDLCCMFVTPVWRLWTCSLITPVIVRPLWSVPATNVYLL